MYDIEMAKFDAVNYVEIEPVGLLRYSVTLIGFSDSIHVTIISMHKKVRNNTHHTVVSNSQLDQ